MLLPSGLILPGLFSALQEKIRDPFQLLERLAALGPACRPSGTCSTSRCC